VGGPERVAGDYASTATQTRKGKWENKCLHLRKQGVEIEKAVTNVLVTPGLE